MYPPLSELYKVLEWHHNDRDKPPGESVGLFAVLPPEISAQFPEAGKDGHDNSPSHITVLYIGNAPTLWERKIVKIAETVCANFRPFKVRLGKPKELINHKGETVRYSPVRSSKLCNLNDVLKRTYLLNQIPVDNKHPEYKPHVTIEYVEEGQNPRFEDSCPVGEWVVDSLWVWGGESPHLIHIGKNR